MYAITRSETEINDLLNRAAEKEDEGDTTAITVRSTLEWLFGDTDGDPLEG